MKPLYSTLTAAFGAALIALGLFVPSLAFFGPLGTVAFFAGTSLLIGTVAFPAERPGIRAAFGFLGALALIAAVGAVVYKIHALDATSIACLLFLTPWAVFAVSPLLESRRTRLPELLDIEKTAPIDTTSLALAVLAAASDIAALRWLMNGATVEAIRSPWDVVQPVYFLWAFVASAAVVVLCYRSRYHHLSLALAAFHLFVTLAPALVVYGIGFGFDPFVHIATERLILKAGSVDPKPLYYLGQYAIVAILGRITPLDIETIDRMLLPSLAALFLPLGSVYLLRRGFKLERHVAVLASLGIFLLPLGSFVSTTPQGLANLFAVMTALLGACWLLDHRPALPYVLLMAAAALAIHPLGGIPAGFIAVFLMLAKLRESREGAWVAKIGKGVVWLAFVGAAALAVPALFIFGAGGQAVVDVSAIRDAVVGSLASLPSVFQVEHRFAPALDLTQLFAANHGVLLFLLAVGGAVILWQRRHYRRTVFATAAAFLTMWASAFVLQHGLSRVGVIDYEQEGYGLRLAETARLLLAPLVLAAVAWWWTRLRGTDPAVRLFQAALFAAAMTALGYAAFPRDDAYAASRGYSVSQHDVNAVREIDERAAGPYIVLADQSMSAAALGEFGFRDYYGGQYFYPIPTGAPLYRYYLDMVYAAPTRQTMLDAMRSVGVHQAFFALDKYWTKSAQVEAAAKKTADAWFGVDGDEVMVFEYRDR